MAFSSWMDPVVGIWKGLCSCFTSRRKKFIRHPSVGPMHVCLYHNLWCPYKVLHNHFSSTATFHPGPPIYRHIGHPHVRCLYSFSDKQAVYFRKYIVNIEFGQMAPVPFEWRILSIYLCVIYDLYIGNILPLDWTVYYR